ncbi:MAG: preprotein translocase subunit SecD [Methanobacterium sp.]|jgi:preprotein translocase subunit SecD
MTDIGDFLKDYRVILLIVLIIGSLAAVLMQGVPQGLDLRGGSIIQIRLEQPVDQDMMDTVTAILDRRLDAFGVKDINVRGSGNQDVIVEIAGVRPEEVVDIIGRPGKFEAKIENQTVLTGADIVTVSPIEVVGTEGRVPFRVSLEGAERFAEAAKGRAGTPVDMYLDDRLVTSPIISEGLAAGRPETDVHIEVPGGTRAEAEKQARDTQIFLQTGALPVSVEILGINSVSAELGDQFVNGALIAGLLTLIVVSVIIFIRYRIPVLVVPIVLTSIAELILILGTASILRWNIDLPAIAGIIAAIGSGVDDQIVITDEVLKGDKGERKRSRTGLRIKIKEAFFIVFAAAATLIVAMLPLAYVGFARGHTGIGILSGFAFTTIIGILCGIFITRPVYAKFIEIIVKER